MKKIAPNNDRYKRSLSASSFGGAKVLSSPWSFLIVTAVLISAGIFIRKKDDNLGPEGSPRSLSLSWESAPRTLDPRYTVDANSQYMENLIHCSLIDFDSDGKTVGDLAKSWTWTTPKTLEVDILGATFDDGRPVRAVDVKATYDFFLSTNTENPSPRKGAFAKVAQVVARTPGKLVFELKEPDSTFVTNLVVGILPADLASGPMLGDDIGRLSGCGPFRLTRFDASGIQLAHNPHFSLGARPRTQSILIKVVKDETTRFAKLRTGELDIVQNLLSRDVLADISKSHPELKVFKRPGLNTTYLGFNMKDAIVGKLKVRQAISHAIDRAKIIKYVLNGLAIPASTLITPNDPFFNSEIQPPSYDIDVAKRLLDEAGYPDPDGDGPTPRFSLIYKTTTNVTRVAIAKAIAAELRKVGVDVTVQPLEWGRFKADVEKGTVQMWSLSWIGFKDPDIFRYVFATESFPPNGGNRGWYSNSELDKLLSAGPRQTDANERKKTYAEIQKIVASELPYVFLWHEEIFAVVNKSVEGFELYADGRFASLRYAYKK